MDKKTGKLNFNSLLVSSENPKVLSEFYGKVLDKKPDMDDGGYLGFLVGSGFITIGPHDKVKGKNKNPEQIIINFETTDVKGEFKRIKDLGTTVVTEPYDMGGMWIATFADPDGNYFQLISPWEPKK
jgi:predicted enzyme related to lactoylglutathione lyase